MLTLYVNPWRFYVFLKFFDGDIWKPLEFIPRIQRIAILDCIAFSRTGCEVGFLKLSAKLILQKAMAPYSSTLSWKIPWTEEPGRLQSMGSLRVKHDWATSLHFKLLQLKPFLFVYLFVHVEDFQN